VPAWQQQRLPRWWFKALLAIPNIHIKLILAVLGPVFLVLGSVSLNRAGRTVPQAKTWLMIGVIFLAVAGWLWFGVP
jgi:hypothetical protein